MDTKPLFIGHKQKLNVDQLFHTFEFLHLCFDNKQENFVYIENVQGIFREFIYTLGVL